MVGGASRSELNAVRRVDRDYKSVSYCWGGRTNYTTYPSEAWRPQAALIKTLLLHVACMDAQLQRCSRFFVYTHSGLHVHVCVSLHVHVCVPVCVHVCVCLHLCGAPLQRCVCCVVKLHPAQRCSGAKAGHA
jgi:hypothetical protein